MVLDFVYGGESFLEHNKDVVDELGDHDYHFTFKFGENNFYFKRGTFEPDLIYTCDKDYQELEPLSIQDYMAFLKASYALEDIDLS